MQFFKLYLKRQLLKSHNLILLKKEKISSKLKTLKLYMILNVDLDVYENIEREAALTLSNGLAKRSTIL